MENPQRDTLFRTLKSRAGYLKILLAAALFISAIHAIDNVYSEAEDRDHPRSDSAPELRSIELMQIFSIVQSNRPEFDESELWRISLAIFGESLKRRLDPLLILALIEIESGFRPAVVSPVGARGMMQILPATGRALLREVAPESEYHENGFQPEILDDPVLNIKLGVYYLHRLKERFRNLALALTAYNYGPSEIDNRLENNIYFSIDFATAVLSAYQKYRKIRQQIF